MEIPKPIKSFSQYGKIITGIEEMNKIEEEYQNSLTEPDKKPFHLAISNRTFSIKNFDKIIDIISLEISEIEKKYNVKRSEKLNEQNENEFFRTHDYGNIIEETTIKKSGLFCWDINIKFHPTEHDEIIYSQFFMPIAMERDLNLYFRIIIYTEEKDKSYTVEMNRLSGNKASIFYDIWDSLKDSLLKIEQIQKLWDNRKEIIMLYEDYRLQNDENRYESTHINHYLDNPETLKELCSFIGYE